MLFFSFKGSARPEVWGSASVLHIVSETTYEDGEFGLPFEMFYLALIHISHTNLNPPLFFS